MKAIYEPKGKAREYAPLACNLYSGCVHGCLYCYVPQVVHRKREEFHAEATPRLGILDALQRDAQIYAGTEWPVLLSFTSDPYPPIEEELEVTRDAIGILTARNIPVHVLTKAGMRAARDFPLLKGRGCAFGTTLVFAGLVGEALREHWEPHAATIHSRVTAIRMAHSLGIPTFVSIEPIIDPLQAIVLIETLSDVVDEWRIGKLHYHAHAQTVDWAEWTPRIYEALLASGRRYLVKESLREYLPEGTTFVGGSNGKA